MEMPSLLTPDVIDRAIGDLLVGLTVQRHPDRKTARCFISNNLNAANGLAPGPLSNGLQALLSEGPVAQSDRLRLRHAKAAKVRPPRLAAAFISSQTCNVVHWAPLGHMSDFESAMRSKADMARRCSLIWPYQYTPQFSF